MQYLYIGIDTYTHTCIPVMIKEKGAIILTVGEGFKEEELGEAGGRKGCDSISIKNIFKIKF